MARAMAIQHAFVTAVLRYLTLHHGEHGTQHERHQLEALLASPGIATSDAAVRGEERRRHRRVDVDIPALTRDADLAAPGRVVDIGGGGMALRNEGGLRLRTGDRVVVSLLPDDWPVRIDLPVEVVRTKGDASNTDEDLVGVRFCGRPLVLHRRLTPPVRGPGHGTAQMGAAS
jgi:hypothetical protein